MNVFEDLIEELKEENLLERTVTDLANGDVQDEFSMKDPPQFEDEILLETEIVETTAEPPPPTALSPQQPQPTSFAEQVPEETGGEMLAEPVVSRPAIETDVPEIVRPQNVREFFRKRAMEEVSSMQMVEHVLSGVEREHMKIVPVPYDDLEAKKALHKFLQASEDPRSQECSDAEYELLQETQKWYGVLADRDKNISVANIRRFCENSRPALSSQALIALARFYRNSPFSEAVRGKFDFIMTRLFSREIEDDKRRLLFAREEMVGHIKTLYGNWSSINLFSMDENEVECSSAVGRFAEFAVEAEGFESLDAMLRSELFDRIRVFKEELGEMFFAAEVLAEGIDCNLRIGNKFVDLVIAARENTNAARLEELYGQTIDHLVSSTTGKTLLLSEILDSTDEEEIFDETDLDEAAARSMSRKADKAVADEGRSRFRLDLFGVNKWLLAGSIAAILLSVGVYFTADKIVGEQSAAIVAKDVEIPNPEIQKHILKMRSTSETLYAVTQPSWDALTEPQQKEFLLKVSAFANEKGLKRVSLLNYKGRTVAYASGDRVEILGPS